MESTLKQIQDVYRVLDMYLERYKDYQLARCRVYEESYSIIKHELPSYYAEADEYELEEITYAWLEQIDVYTLD